MGKEKAENQANPAMPMSQVQIVLERNLVQEIFKEIKAETLSRFMYNSIYNVQ